MATYSGFSSFEFQRKKTFSLTDIDLVKMDIVSHVFTPRGSRVMMPNFGSIIPDIVFEPLDQNTVDIATEEISNIIDFDPRVELLDLQALPDFDNSSLTIAARVHYIEFDIVDNLDLNIIFEG